MALVAVGSQFRAYKWLTNCLSVVSHGQRVAGRGLVKAYACAARTLSRGYAITDRNGGQ